ncbi:MAG TPA: hypothetical protein DCS91_21765 [Microcoleaceae bacterium UBA11344]|jgi:hypothetical protein|nr:hypothetical protein [Microcoleaceae cyanobacterium UBA11344]
MVQDVRDITLIAFLPIALAGAGGAAILTNEISNSPHFAALTQSGILSVDTGKENYCGVKNAMTTSLLYWEQTATIRYLVEQKLIKIKYGPYHHIFFSYELSEDEIIQHYNLFDSFFDRFKFRWYRVKDTDMYRNVTQHPYIPTENLTIGSYVSPCGNYSAKLTKL